MSRWTHFWSYFPASDPLPIPFAGTLELKKEQKNAHNGWVMSVGYDKDGEKIVSGGQDGTIKVWDACAILGPKPPLTRPDVWKAGVVQPAEHRTQGGAVCDGGPVLAVACLCLACLALPSRAASTLC